MREPRVKNRYNLTVDCIKSLKVIDYSKIGEPLFWRNNSINAWCMSGNTMRSHEDSRFGSYSSYWIAIKDDEPTRVDIKFSAYGGMCDYEFNEFYNKSFIQNDIDLRIQESALETINRLIDEGILAKVK